MKKIVASAIAIGCLAAAGTALAGMEAATGVTGSLHDMNTFVLNGKADSMGRVCVFCHTPHHAGQVKTTTVNGVTTTQTIFDQAPLWNRLDTTQNFQAYQWVTPANKGTDTNTVAFAIDDPLKGPSRLCMSCHDGSIAVDQHGDAYAQSGATVGKIGTIHNGRSNLGTDLNSTHPIGFNYVEIAAWRNSIAGNGEGTDTEIVSPSKGFAIAVATNTAAGTYGTVTRATDNAKRIKDVLFEGEWMTCASCHEVHNKENVVQDNFYAVDGVTPNDGRTYSTGNRPNYFLYAKENQSLICLSCHIK